MQKCQATYCAAIAIAAGLIAIRTAEAADNFRKLSDNEIRSKLAGMEITDDVHWAEQYMRDGSFKGFDMGRATKGTWHAQNGEFVSTTERQTRAAERSGSPATRSSFERRTDSRSKACCRSSSRASEVL
jgi:hypothetical protein